MSLSLILQTLIALPKIVGLVASLIKAVNQQLNQMKENGLNQAIDGLQQGDEDIKKANEQITKNLP